MFLLVQCFLKSSLFLSGVSISRFKATRERFGLCGHVQIHHIIPRQFRGHPCLQHFDMNNGYNLMFMPALPDSRIRTTRREHQGGHPLYNKYVGGRLSEIYSQSKSSGDQSLTSSLNCCSSNVTIRQKCAVMQLTHELRQALRDDTVPWR